MSETGGGSGAKDPFSSATEVEFAAAKLNLFLHITGRRSDGYHVLESLVVFADIGDRVAVSPSDGLSLCVTGPFGAGLDVDPMDNLVLRGARALAAEIDVVPRVAIGLDKRLPVAAGIGGGSADAAATLRVLMRFWNVSLARDRLHALALGLGADVPACLESRPVIMRGIGETLEPLARRWPMPHVVLVNPGRTLSTAAVFAARDGEFTTAPSIDRDLASEGDVVALLARRRNDLEPAARRLEPAIGVCLAALAEQPQCRLARMSGSGATCFGIFPSPEAASNAAAAIGATHPGWWAVAAATIDR